MAKPLIIPLQSIRTDGWFERVGEGTASFQALCDIVGPRFVAFALITGARIRTLTVDRRAPDYSVVEFSVGGEEEEGSEDVYRLSLAEFRTRLVDALLIDEPCGPEPTRETDLEAVQLHIGSRYMLLAPLYGYSLVELRIDEDGSLLGVLADGAQRTYPLAAFQMGLRMHVREDLQRTTRGGTRGTIDLDKVKSAKDASERGEYAEVVEMLGGWVLPLSIFLRTPEGQLLSPETRGIIAEGLEHLGSSCLALGQAARAEEALRLAVQYAGDGPAAAGAYGRLGHALLSSGRPGEALAPLRRAVALTAGLGPPLEHLAQAFLERGRLLAAHAAATRALQAGSPEDRVEPIFRAVKAELGEALERWQARADDG